MFNKAFEQQHYVHKQNTRENYEMWAKQGKVLSKDSGGAA